MEILPGIHRIESDLGERFMCQYLLIGEERTALVDTGPAGTPEEVIVPYLGEIGLGVGDEVIISHADAELGPYPAFMIELGAGVRTHLGLLGPNG